MMWLTWRQFRAQAYLTSAAAAVLAVILVVTGLHVAHLYNASGIAACQGHGSCGTLASKFISELKGTAYQGVFYACIVAVYAVPAIIGVFWGAPLITRELEGGTFRLAWTQSVTRARWITVKLGFLGLAAVATVGLLSLMTSWWASPIYRAGQQAVTQGTSISRLGPALFGATGVVPVGYAAFAFVLGVTAGVLIRRTVPAMAVTLAAFTAVQLAMALWIRPHLITALRAVSPLNLANLNGLMIDNNSSMTVIGAVTKPAAWVLANQTIDTAGHVFTGPATPACLSQTASQQACTASLARLHLRQLLTYQPASRYWAFQWSETAIFLVLAVALAGFCFWRIQRRRLF